MSLQTIWFSPLNVLSGDPSIAITYPSVAGPHTIVRATQIGDLKWVALPLALPVGSEVRAIRLSYSIENARRLPTSVISQIRLLEVAPDGRAVVRHDDPTDLTGAGSHESRLGSGVVVSGGINAALRLNFEDKTDAIVLRALGVEYMPPAAGMATCAKRHDYVHVAEFGAVGDGVADDAAAIQAAVDAAIASGRRVLFDASTYTVGSPIVLRDFVSLSGTPRAGDKWTIVRALNPMRSVIDLRAGARRGLTFKIADIHFDAARRASYAIYLQGCSFGTFEGVGAGNALFDGIYLAKSTDEGVPAIDDGNRWINLQVGRNGTFFTTPDLRAQYVLQEGNPTPRVFPEQVVDLNGACVAVDKDSNIANFTGVDLRTLALRAGDPIRIVTGTAKEHFPIVEVLSPTSAALAEPADATAGGLSFCIGRGDGYHEEEGDGDNNSSLFEYGLWRNNAGKALQIQGSYGCRMIGGFVEYSPFWGIMVGVHAPGYVSTSISPLFLGTYFEAISRKPFYLRSCLGLVMAGLVAPEGTEAYDTPGTNESLVRGVRISDSGIQPIGSVFNAVPSTRLSDGAIQGHSILYGSIVQPISESGTNDVAAPFWHVMPSEDFTMDLRGRPTFAIRGGKFFVLYSGSGGTITLHDDRDLEGTKLRLRSPTVSLGPHEAMMLVCDGTYWVQIGS